MNLDQMGLPSGTKCDVQIFRPGSPQMWVKPRGVTMAFIIAIGGGAGGGNGALGIAGSSRVGGGGGGSGAIAKALVPLIFLPDSLYMKPGRGGASASSGAISIISVEPGSAAASVVLRSGAAAAAPGFGATGGAAETISTTTLSLWAASCGIPSFIAGKIGAAGGAAGSVGNSNTILTASHMNGGSGGGGCVASPVVGGFQLAGSIYQTFSGVGSGGISLVAPLIGLGGCGGGSSNSGPGGDGGDGGFPGGGGGGGGASVTSAAKGGRGGDGMIMVVCW